MLIHKGLILCSHNMELLFHVTNRLLKFTYILLACLYSKIIVEPLLLDRQILRNNTRFFQPISKTNTFRGQTGFNSITDNLLCIGVNITSLSNLNHRIKRILVSKTVVANIRSLNTSSGFNGSRSILRLVGTCSTKSGIGINSSRFVTLTNSRGVIIFELLLVKIHLTLESNIRGFTLVLVLLLK